MAGGGDRPYLAGHREMLERVSDVGLLVSEQSPAAIPIRARFTVGLVAGGSTGIANVVTNINDVRALSKKQPPSGSMPQLSAESFRMDRYSAHVRAAHATHRDL